MICINYNFSCFNFFGCLLFWTGRPLLKQKKASLSTNTALVLPIVQQPNSFILMIVSTFVKTHHKSMPNNLYEACLYVNTIMAVEFFPKMMQLQDSLSEHSSSFVKFQDVPSQTGSMYVDLFTPKYH